jgi:hypothetical protein
VLSSRRHAHRNRRRWLALIRLIDAVLAEQHDNESNAAATSEAMC